MGDIDVRSNGRVLEVVLRRAAKRNALTARMYSALADALDRLDSDPESAAMVFTAEGEHFCAGNDLGEFFGDYDLATGSPWRCFIDGLAGARKPLIAAVQGHAVGIGMTMLLHCDLVFVEPTARLSAPFGRLGLVPEAGSSQLLPALIGHQRAAEMFLLGRWMNAEEAHGCRLANAIAPAGRARDLAMEAAAQIAALPPASVLEIKNLMRSPTSRLEDRIAAECVSFMACLRTPQTTEVLQRLAKSGR